MADVSVVIPARNVAATIEETLETVLRESRVAEVILINDGSTDDTLARITAIPDPRLRVIPGPCTGIAGALNTGFEAATAPYVIRCDGDDLMVAGALDWMGAYLDTHPDFIAVSGGFATISETGRHLADLSCDMPAQEMTDALLAGRSHTHLCAWLIRRAALLRTGGARPFFETAEDIDLQYRLAQEGRIWHEPRVAYLYRLHAGSITHGARFAKTAFFDKAAAEFARQRAETGTDDLAAGKPPIFTPDLAVHTKHPMRKQMAGHLTRQAWRDFDKRQLGSGLMRLVRAIGYDPANWGIWTSLGAYVLKAAARKLTRR